MKANSSGNAYNDAASKNTNQKNNVASNKSHQENNAASKNTNQKNSVASNNSHQENNAASHAEKKSLAADETDNVLKVCPIRKYCIVLYCTSKDYYVRPFVPRTSSLFFSAFFTLNLNLSN